MKKSPLSPILLLFLPVHVDDAVEDGIHKLQRHTEDVRRTFCGAVVAAVLVVLRGHHLLTEAASTDYTYY